MDVLASTSCMDVVIDHVQWKSKLGRNESTKLLRSLHHNDESCDCLESVTYRNCSGVLLHFITPKTPYHRNGMTYAVVYSLNL